MAVHEPLIIPNVKSDADAGRVHIMCGPHGSGIVRTAGVTRRRSWPGTAPRGENRRHTCTGLRFGSRSALTFFFARTTS